jgi:cytosine/adenosine deaminase-related metal-dependent hydrolase
VKSASYLIGLLALAACGDNLPGTTTDGSVDGRPDAMADAMIDAPIDAMPDAPPDAPPGDGPTITPGASDRILLVGTLVTPDTVIDGELLVVGDHIACMGAAGDCATTTDGVGATVIITHGIIAPGLIDTHNHILFDIFDNDDWLPEQLYDDHEMWTSEPRYGAMLDVKQCLVNDSQGKPAWCANTPYGTSAGSLRCEVDKFGELKGLVAGTTSIVGLPGTSSACFGSLARSVDVSQNGLGMDKIQTSATFPPSNGTGVCTNIASGKTDAFLVHVGEGKDPRALGEFARLGTSTTPAGCLYAPQTTITHGVAFGATEFQIMGDAGMKLTWSPQSNVSLYGVTADIPTALAAGVTIALGPDWSMGGSQNMLDEMRFADAWDNAHWSNVLAPKDIVTMATQHGAQALALQDRLGTLAVGKLADIAVFSGDVTQPYDAILAAKPKQVELVMVGGTVLYGDAALSAAGPASPGCETIDICGASKFLCVATSTTTSKLNQTYTDITSALQTALTAADAETPGDGYNFAPLAPLVTCGP